MRIAEAHASYEVCSILSSAMKKDNGSKEQFQAC